MSAADALPRFHHRERHSIRVSAPPEAVLEAAKVVTVDDLRLTRALLRLRGLGTPRRRALWDVFAAAFSAYDEQTFVLVGKPWQLRGGRRPEVSDFAAFFEPGYAKVALDLRALPDGEGTRLETETRVLLTDSRARRRFALYWLVIRPFSGLIRRDWLRAARRRAEFR